MSRRIGRERKPSPARQRLLPFQERIERLHRRFKRMIVLVSLLAAVGMLGGTEAGRYHVALWAQQARLAPGRLLGVEPARAEIEAFWRLKRHQAVARARQSLARSLRQAGPAMERLFRVAGMAPENALVRWGRADEPFVLSSQVFELDESGRSYHLRPNTRSVWLRQVTLQGAPLALILVPDTPEVRAAAGTAGAIVDEPSVQTTNSWGLRGPEPDLQATVRGLVLGDSFMQAMFNDDQNTPSLHLERTLRDAWNVPVSVLNTGHIGYSPEQYYATLQEYGDRFRPHFVVVSVCPNDFGEGWSVMLGKGDWYAEAGYWLDEIVLWCRRRLVPLLLVPVPTDGQLIRQRRDDRYPGKVCELFHADPSRYYDPLDAFINEDLRLKREPSRRGARSATDHSPLYNLHIADNHFSPRGAALWARVVGERITLIVSSPKRRDRGGG